MGMSERAQVYIENEPDLLYDDSSLYVTAQTAVRTEKAASERRTGKEARTMTCRDAQRLVTPYINGSITDQELEEFLKHIDSCPDCREELEIYFTVDVGIRQLDEGTGTYNIKGALETALALSRQRLRSLHLLKITRYAVNTLCFWSVLVVLIIQMRIWGQAGF